MKIKRDSSSSRYTDLCPQINRVAYGICLPGNYGNRCISCNMSSNPHLPTLVAKPFSPITLVPPSHKIQ
jgi:hypothetical protein